MCFLKNVNQRSTFSPPSAFKKIAPQSGPSSDHSLQSPPPQTKLDENCQLGSEETIEQTAQQPFTPAQSLQLQWLMEFIQTNNTTMFTLIQRNQEMERNLMTLTSELDELKKNLQTTPSKKSLPVVSYQENQLADQLSLRLFGRKEYRYSMALAEPLNKQLYKERNFDLRINLIDANGEQILNSNPIPISLCVYSADEQPTVIVSSKSDQPMIKGNSESELFHGAADFRKIHLREVSSYFTNGWLHLVVYPKAPSFSYNAKESTLEQTVDYRLIKPLVISEVVVRAKKK